MLLDRVESHMKAYRVPPARFGRDVMGDPQFVFQLREGREPRPRTVARVLSYLAQFEGQRP